MGMGLLKIDPLFGSSFGNLLFGGCFVDGLHLGDGNHRQEFGKEEEQGEEEAQGAYVHADFNPRWGIHQPGGGEVIPV